ncbi:hypothetical protein EW146_g7168 [Bondarzewia mesenterica]|uniref:Uncharacterized protein n=1 Tax=Bondarzewia mesenterica TaxID=1095465 RepID=A0A4S4LLH8_9AGAM|nr:hypothetical protein EW146_g7168 [Bondarzewia mesenterica]
MAILNDGFGFFSTTLKVSFPKSLTAADLEGPVTAAWIRLRHSVPAVGTKINPLSATSWQFVYSVPSSTEDAKAWAGETIFWNTEKMSAFQRDESLKSRWWKPSSPAWNMELHIGPDEEEGKWHFVSDSIIAGHYVIDARSSQQLFGHFFQNLAEHLEGKGTDAVLASLKWGEETVRLAPSGVLVALEAGGLPISLCPPPQAAKSKTNGLDVASKEVAPPAPPPIFLRPFRVVDPDHATGQRLSVIWLTQEETAKFRNACKAHKFTITQALTALMFIAEVEWALKRHNGETEEEVKQAVEAYKSSLLILSAWNIVDQRRTWKEYALHSGPKGSPSLGIDGIPITYDMNLVRKVVKYDETKQSVTRDTSAIYECVQAAAEAWKSTSLDYEAYVQREVGCQAALLNWDPKAFHMPAFVASSIGDIDQLGYLSRFSPATQKNDKAPLVVEEVWGSDRMTEPIKMVMSWQWNGRIIVSAQTGAKYVTQQALDAYSAVLKGWIGELSA